MAKKLEYLIIHCTATPEGRIVTAKDIREWHLSKPPEGRGWKQVGYSDMILLGGTVLNLVKYDDDDEVDPWEITNGVAGINGKSRHIVYVGGTDAKGKAKDTRTDVQRATMLRYCKNMVKLYPDIKIAGHNQFDPNKACPSFNVPLWLELMGFPEQNIYIK